MKYCHFFTVSLRLLCACLILASCQKTPEIKVFPANKIIDAFPEEDATFDISTDVDWIITIKPIIPPDEDWLTVSPMQGKGNATITIKAGENPTFDARYASIAISGNGVKSDTVWVTQMPDVDLKNNIEDEAFREYCLQHFDEDQDGIISMKEARRAFEIIVKRLHVHSLAGIEYFINITKLDCRDNEIESIDVSNNLKLRELDCFNNAIRSLDVSKNVELRKIDCSYNPIDHIDVSGLTKLTDLFVHSSELTSIDVSNNPKLEWLAISNNKVMNIDVSNNKELQGLECNENGLTTISVSNNTKLLTLYCGNNKLTTLNIDNNTALSHLWCNNNLLTSINLNNNKDLQTLMCANNSFSSLTLSNNTKLAQLYCSANQLSTLSLSKNIDLKQLHCDANPLTTLDLSYNTKLEGLRCTDSKLQNEINIAKNNRLIFIELQNNPTLSTIYVWQGFIEISDYKKDKTAQWVRIP